MIEILLVTDDRTAFTAFANGLEKEGALVAWAATGKDALQRCASKAYSLLITDEKLPDMPGLELAKQTIQTNPMINLAAVSALSPKDFHEASEGLGILSQLPSKPDRQEAIPLLALLKNVI